MAVEIHEKAIVHPSVILEGNIRVGKYTYIGAGTVIIGEIEIGEYTRIFCNCTLRSATAMRIGSYINIFDNVNIESGRGIGLGGITAPDESCVEDWCYVNHGAVMHGTAVRSGAIVGMGATCQYGTVVGPGAIVADGSAVGVNTKIPANAMVQGVPAVLVKEDLTDADRLQYMGLEIRPLIEAHAKANIRMAEEGWRPIGVGGPDPW